MRPFPAIESDSRALRWAVVLAVVGAAWVVYWPALRGAWLWDDGLELSQNTALRASDGWWTPWVRPAGMDYFPLKGTFQWAEWRLFGESTVGYHAVSVCLHALGGLLLWRLLSLCSIPYGGLAALLFVVHPVAVESVAWMSEQKNGLSLVLALSASCLYVEFSKGASWRLYAWATGLFCAALLCKSTVVTLPVCLGLLVLFTKARLVPRNLWPLLPWLLLSLGLGLVTVYFQGHRAIGVSGPMPGPSERLSQAGWSLLLYLRDAVLPLWLAPVYAPVPASLPAVLPWAVALGAGVVLVVRWRTWGRPVLLGLSWIFLPLVPVCGVVALSYLRVAPRADHLAYLSLLGVCGLASAAAVLGIGKAPSRARSILVAGVALVVIVALGAVARVQAAHYRSPKALWTWAVERNPDAWLARNNLGQVLLGEGNAREALVQFEAAATLRPDSAEVQGNVGDARLALGQVDAARAAFERALALDPGLAGIRYDLALVALRQGNLSVAITQAQATLAINPSHAGAHNVLGLALARSGRPEEASVQFGEALRADPASVEAHLNLGNLNARAGRPDQAIAEYRKALAIDPSYEPARRNLVSLLRYLGRDDEARRELKGGGKP